MVEYSSTSRPPSRVQSNQDDKLHQYHETKGERNQQQQKSATTTPTSTTAQRRPSLVSEQDATKLVSSFLFGWNPQNNNDEKEFTEATLRSLSSSSSSSLPASPERLVERQRLKVAPDGLEVADSNATDIEKTKASSTSTKSIQQQHQQQQPPVSLSSTDKMIAAITSRLDQWIPEDSEALRQSKVYQEAYKAIEWQRDNYVVGSDYANWRKKMRKGEDRGSGMGVVGGLDQYRLVLPPVPYEETALAHAQLADLAANFIPSPTVKQALLPLVVTLPCGPLLQPARNSLVNVVLGSQHNLDKVVKSSILTFLNNPANRAMIKNSTKGYIVSSATYRDGNANTDKPVQTAME